MLTIRKMQLEDLEGVMQIQARCYRGNIPESKTSLVAKWFASPDTCFIALADHSMVGYLFSLPWTSSAPPQLNARECELPPTPDCLYLHDLSVHPDWRNKQVGKLLVDQFFVTLSTQAWPQACLVAVQDSTSYWSRYGFQVVVLATDKQIKLESYGKDARFMSLSRSEASN
ncbi:GNAT family N-acetyltransferase [Undibacterium fentianense]|uniref:GNAT family N-acetyltransferase n=1 Tax=Undibacterium fentianense TaxID=2828728 RepID=A0A941E549_9BURK|nr:GNAT family N-acetyltransferase [Undibacterium fentianense]MBR7801756.1 GNAT family N-acetyltransferase [Undibacterium fentianense]